MGVRSFLTAFHLSLLEKAAEKVVSEDVFLGLRGINEDNPRWTALLRMLDHPYGSKVWIMQEVVVSQKMHICYGGL
jgi:hypothetical protein